MALASYSDLIAAIDTWSDRSYAEAQKQEFIALFEADANLLLGSAFERKTSATITTDTTGSGTLPTGCVRVETLTRDIAGSLPLKQVDWASLIQRNPFGDADEPSAFALKGTGLKLDTPTADDFLALYWSRLTGLSASNTTNWLLAEAPNAYLFGCRAAQLAFEEDDARAASYAAKAQSILEAIVVESNVAEYGSAEITFPYPLP